MSESKRKRNRIILQFIGGIIGILLFAVGGALLVTPLYTVIFWAVHIGDAPLLFQVSEYYVSTVLGTMVGLGSMGLGFVLMLWFRPS